MFPTNITRMQLLSLIDTPVKLTTFLMGEKLLSPTQFCYPCNRYMTLQQSKDSKDGVRWKCNGRACNKCTKSIRKGSFFEKSKLSLHIGTMIIYEWSRDTSVKSVVFEYGVSKVTVVDWFRFLRDVCFDYFAYMEQSRKIGGVGYTVEVDETVAVRRKYNVGRVVPTVWLVGGIVRGSSFGAFLEIVENRSEIVLTELLKRNIAPGTVVMTDLWKGYGNLTREGFEHHCVNHSLNFVDPVNRNIHTQKIEGLWSVLKRWLRSKGTNRKKHLDEYFVEFIYRKKF